MLWTRKPSSLELAHDRAIRDLEDQAVASEGYVERLDIVARLHRMLEEEKSHLLSRDTMAVITANLLGILMIIKHEHVNVIVSRAMSLVIKPKINA